MRAFRIVMLAVCAALFATGASAQLDLSRDVAGAKDHPLIPRYEGSVIFGYKVERYVEANMPLGPATKSIDARRGFEKVEKLEGPRTRILYLAPPQRTSLEVYRNYRNALEKQGFATVYECRGDECGVQIEDAIYYDSKERLITNNQVAAHAFTMGVEDPRLWVGKLDRREGPLWVLVFAGHSGNSADGRAGNRVSVLVDIVDKGAMEQRMVKVDAREIATNLSRDGRQVIYGILFDTDKAEIKPDSKPQLDEMAALMKANPALKVFIVGHTDNQGTIEHNLGLSQRRAEAVVRTLSTQYGIAAARMAARGLGPFAPVASNDTEDGRARNRRVEIVKQ
jgi:outer membrane protein OmpA-like peptidoglycan-associated protein